MQFYRVQVTVLESQERRNSQLDASEQTLPQVSGGQRKLNTR